MRGSRVRFLCCGETAPCMRHVLNCIFLCFAPLLTSQHTVSAQSLGGSQRGGGGPAPGNGVLAFRR